MDRDSRARPSPAANPRPQRARHCAPPAPPPHAPRKPASQILTEKKEFSYGNIAWVGKGAGAGATGPDQGPSGKAARPLYACPSRCTLPPGRRSAATSRGGSPRHRTDQHKRTQWGMAPRQGSPSSVDPAVAPDATDEAESVALQGGQFGPGTARAGSMARAKWAPSPHSGSGRVAGLRGPQVGQHWGAEGDEHRHSRASRRPDAALPLLSRPTGRPPASLRLAPSHRVPTPRDTTDP